MDHTVWNTLYGNFFSLRFGEDYVSRLSVHADFILILLSPLYLLWNDVRALIISESVFLAIGAIPTRVQSERRFNSCSPRNNWISSICCFVIELPHKLVMNKLYPDVIIERLTKFSSKDANSIRRLAAQLGSGYQPLTDGNFKDILKSPTTYLFVARHSNNKEIVGMATLIICRIPYVKKATFDDLIVYESFQGQGIGRQLSEKVMSVAKKSGAAYIDFTSSPKRIKANKLYEKLGFKKRDTNIYRLTFNYAKK